MISTLTHNTILQGSRPYLLTGSKIWTQEPTWL